MIAPTEIIDQGHRLVAVVDAADGLTRAAQAVEDARAVLYESVRAAYAAGVSPTVIAEAAGVSRQTVYNVIGRGEG